MASATVDPIDWFQPLPSWAVPPELPVLHGVNAAFKSQNLLQQPGLEHASTGMPDQRTAALGHVINFFLFLASQLVMLLFCNE